MGVLRRWMAALSQWQGRHNRIAVPHMPWRGSSATTRQPARRRRVGWYGFTAIYPLLLVVVTVFGFIGEASLGPRLSGPCTNSRLWERSSTRAGGSTSSTAASLGLVIGCVGLVYGAQGVTQTAEQAITAVWNIPRSTPRLLAPTGPQPAGLLSSAGVPVNASSALRRRVRGPGRRGPGIVASRLNVASTGRFPRPHPRRVPRRSLSRRRHSPGGVHA